MADSRWNRVTAYKPTDEIASRANSIEWWQDYFGYLPDPDPILKKTGHELSVYRMLLTDAHVWACAQSRKSGILSQEWQITPPESQGVRANKAAVNMITDAFGKLDIDKIMSDILEAPFFGISPLEIMWGPDWRPTDVVGKPPEWFVFDLENRLRFLSRYNMIQGELLPDKKFLLARHGATYQNPYGERALARCFWPVTFKRGGLKFWSIFTEKFGMPWVIGKVPRGTNETERAEIETSLTSMVQDAVAVVNDDESIEIIEAEGKAGSATIFEALVKSCNDEISKAILGQTLTTELNRGGGSYAAAQVHFQVRDDIVQQDAKMVSGLFNQLISWITGFNSANTALPTFSFYEEENLQLERAQRDTELYKQGVKPQRSYYIREYNFQEDDLPEDMDTQRAQPAVAPVPGQEQQFAEAGKKKDFDLTSATKRKSTSPDSKIYSLKR